MFLIHCNRSRIILDFLLRSTSSLHNCVSVQITSVYVGDEITCFRLAAILSIIKVHFFMYTVLMKIKRHGARLRYGFLLYAALPLNIYASRDL